MENTQEIPSEDYVPVYVHKAHARKMFNAFKNGRGINMKYEHVHGGSFNSFFRGVGRTLKRAGNTVAHTLKPLAGVGKTVAKIGLPMAGAVVGDMLGGPLGGVAGGVAGQMASNAIGNGFVDDMKKLGRKVKRTYNKVARSKEMRHIANSARPMLRELKEVGKAAAHEMIANHAMNSMGDNQHLNTANLILTNHAHNAVQGMGLGKRPPKGSPEMKEYMARLRSMRKKKNDGGSFVF